MMESSSSIHGQAQMDPYVLITAARNEEAYVETTIRAVIAQTKKPLKWIIVSDGSTDRTDDIVKQYEERHDFIRLLRKEGTKKRNFGSQVHAINSGYEELRKENYEYIGNLDADISFEPNYYEILLDRFKKDDTLGLVGGYLYDALRGKFVVRKYNHPQSVPHGIQLFRRECYEKIGGYMPLPYGGPDTVAGVSARMYGWQVSAYDDLAVYHHRPSVSADGILRGAYQQGKMDYDVGHHPMFEVGKIIRRMDARPLFVYAMTRLCGYIFACIKREKRIVSDEFVCYLRTEEKTRLKNILKSIQQNKKTGQ